MMPRKIIIKSFFTIFPDNRDCDS